jgi:hypothetical protein
MINSCEYLNDFFSDEGGCNSCKSEVISFGPAIRNITQDKQCFVSSEHMMLNCDNAEKKFERVCPCLPIGPEPKMVNGSADLIKRGE